MKPSRTLFWLLAVALSMNAANGFFKKKAVVYEKPSAIDPRTLGLFGYLKGMSLYRKYIFLSHNLDILGTKWNSLVNIEINNPLPIHAQHHTEFMPHYMNYHGNSPLLNGVVNNVHPDNGVILGDSESMKKKKPTTTDKPEVLIEDQSRMGKLNRRVVRELPVTEAFSTSENETSTSTMSLPIIRPNTTNAPQPLPDVTTSKPWTTHPPPYPPSNPTCGYNYGNSQHPDANSISLTNGGHHGSYYEHPVNYFRPSYPDLFQNQWDYYNYLRPVYPPYPWYNGRRRHLK